MSLSHFPPSPPYPTPPSYTIQCLCFIHAGLLLTSRCTVLFYASAFMLCYSLCLQCPTLLLCSGSTAGPWKPSSCEISAGKSSWFLGWSTHSFLCYPVSCWIYILHWNCLYVWHFSKDFQGSYLSQYPLLCLAQSGYLMIIIVTLKNSTGCLSLH